MFRVLGIYNFVKDPKSLLGMTQLIVFCIDVQRTYVVWNDSFWVNFLSYGTKLMEENKAKLYIVYENCWLETQSTLAVFGENYYHSKTLVFFADFCSYFTLDQIRMNHNDPHFSVFWYQPPPGGKVHTFWEGHNILRNLHLNFDWHCIGQKYGGDFAKVFGLLRIYELYWVIQYLRAQDGFCLRSG